MADCFLSVVRDWGALDIFAAQHWKKMTFWYLFSWAACLQGGETQIYSACTCQFVLWSAEGEHLISLTRLKQHLSFSGCGRTLVGPPLVFGQSDEVHLFTRAHWKVIKLKNPWIRQNDVICCQMYFHAHWLWKVWTFQVSIWRFFTLHVLYTTIAHAHIATLMQMLYNL